MKMTNDIAKQLIQQIKELNEAYAMQLDLSDGRMPCSITDDPYNNYSHWHDKTGPYAEREEEDCFDAYREQRDRAGPPEHDPNEPNDYESKTHGY
jgi:hypothetical protein